MTQVYLLTSEIQDTRCPLKISWLSFLFPVCLQISKIVRPTMLSFYQILPSQGRRDRHGTGDRQERLSFPRTDNHEFSIIMLIGFIKIEKNIYFHSNLKKCCWVVALCSYETQPRSQEKRKHRST